MLSFEPSEKELEANEEFALNAFFIPQQKRNYKIIVPVEAMEDAIIQNFEVGYHNPGSGSTEQPSSNIQQGRKTFTL